MEALDTVIKFWAFLCLRLSSSDLNDVVFGYNLITLSMIKEIMINQILILTHSDTLYTKLLTLQSIYDLCLSSSHVLCSNDHFIFFLSSRPASPFNDLAITLSK